MTGRGVNYWQSENGRDRRLFFLIDNFLQAVDARTGQSILSFGTNGVVNLRDGLPRGEYMGWSQSGKGLAQPADPRFDHRRGVHLTPG
jgi:quinoprotein glucose dehydrogenase